MEQSATVIDVVGDYAWVETRPVSSCSHCSSSSCTSSVLADLLTPKTNTFCLVNDVDARVGDTVIVGLSDKYLFSASVQAYLVPLLFLLLVVGSAQMAGASDVVQVLFGVLGLGLGYAWMKWKTQSAKDRSKYLPRLLRVEKNLQFTINSQQILRS